MIGIIAKRLSWWTAILCVSAGSLLLDSVAFAAPKRGRRRTMESVDRRLAAIDEELTTADPMRRLKLVQERRDLTAERKTLAAPIELGRFEDAFVEIAASYSRRQGISYQSWREIGVPAAVLSRARVSRSQ